MLRLAWIAGFIKTADYLCRYRHRQFGHTAVKLPDNSLRAFDRILLKDRAAVVIFLLALAIFAYTFLGAPIGIPFVAVPASQTKFPATFTYQSESDTGPYAIPLDAPIEGGSTSTDDRHATAIDTGNCILYEIYDAYPQAASWQGGSGAI